MIALMACPTAVSYTHLAEASAHFNELSARIKAAETRMAEIAVLREHIVNYAKTRDTYVAYRKAGYSKKFLAEHESEITIQMCIRDSLRTRRPGVRIPHGVPKVL